MLKVQQFIEEHDVDALTRDYGITVKQYETERVAVFNYDMIDSPKTDPIVAFRSKTVDDELVEKLESENRMTEALQNHYG